MALNESRQFHESFAIEDLKGSEEHLRRAVQTADRCGTSLGHLLQATRAVAQSRVHLVSVGNRDAKRTRKLWGVVGKREKAIDDVRSRFVKNCVRSSK